jgi:hypothetical protein
MLILIQTHHKYQDNKYNRKNTKYDEIPLFGSYYLFLHFSFIHHVKPLLQLPSCRTDFYAKVDFSQSVYHTGRRNESIFRQDKRRKDWVAINKGKNLSQKLEQHEKGPVFGPCEPLCGLVAKREGTDTPQEPETAVWRRVRKVRDSLR